jgi:hypothetical protein
MLKSICQSRKLAALETDGARLLYTWLIPNLDINGCFSGDSVIVRSLILTRLSKTDDEVQYYLNDMERVGLICLYESDGDTYLNVPDFTDKQPRLNPSKEAKSRIPLPTPDQLQTNSRLTLPKVKESKEEVKVKSKKQASKDKHSDFVLLSKDEYEKLIDKFGKDIANNKIGSLNEYIGSTGKKYKSHYHTILMWARKDTAGKPVQDTKKAQHATWEGQCGGWLRQSNKETIENHASFMQRLDNPEFRAWAIGVNSIVKEITCNQ